MKVAILIPTLNRLSFLRRTVLYYDAIQSPHPIYIGDASNTETSNDAIAFLTDINNVVVKYFHWEKLSFEKTTIKLAKEASAEFEYCTYQGDDDYFIPSSLTKCAIFLSKNFDYRTAQGRAGLVTMDGQEPLGTIKDISEYWGKNSLEESSKIERLLSFHDNYFVAQFSVHRINEFIADSSDFSTIINSHISEQLHCYTFAIKGKSKFIDCLYLIRVRHPDLYIRHYEDDVFEAMSRENWHYDYNKIIDSLSIILSDDDKISLSEAKKIISDLIKQRLKFTIKHYLQLSINNEKKKSFYIRLKNIVPCYLINKLKYTKNKLLNKEMNLLMIKHSRFRLDFLPIVNSLTGKKFSDDEKQI